MMITGALQWSIGRKHGVNLAWLAWLDLNLLDGALMVSMYSTNDIHSRGHIKLYLRAHFIQFRSKESSGNVFPTPMSMSVL